MTFPIAQSDSELEAQARVDLTKYIACMMRSDTDGCIAIEKRYGLYGLSPQQVSEELFEIAASQEPELSSAQGRQHLDGV
jgi:hypothetical protein